ncbi:MFS transporter [Phormidium tenue FACHB-886]|nr:MFS transporter [Phormidium tenue FACHB-886]
MNLKDKSASSLSPSSSLFSKRGTVFVLAIACGLAVANLYYNQPLLANMGRDFNVSVQDIGFVPMLGQIGYALGLLVLAPLGDMMERRKLILLLLTFSGFALAAAALSPNLTWLSISSLVLGLTNITAQVIIPFVAQLTPTAERGKVIGTLLSGALMGVLLARTVSGLIGGYWGWRSMYWIAAALMIGLALVLRYWLPLNPPQMKLSYAELMQSIVQLVQKEPELRAASLNAALMFGAYSAFWATLIFFVEGSPYFYGSQAAGLFGLLGVASAVYSPWVGRLTDQHNPRVVVTIGVLHMLLAFIFYWSIGNQLAGLIIGILIMDVGKVLTFVANQTRIYRLAPDAPSRVNTVFMVSTFIGGALASFAGAYCWENWQWNGVCGLSGSLLAIALVAHIMANRIAAIAKST